MEPMSLGTLPRRSMRMASGISIIAGGSRVTDREPGYDRVTGRPFASRSEVIARNGMAATSHPLATQVALDILKAGGSAVDAAIAANAALGLMEPGSNGVGGDLFAMVWDAEKSELVGLNSSGRAPAMMTREYFKAAELTQIPMHGILPVSVPGAVDGWFELHARFGRLPMSELLSPSITYARDGFPVTEVIGQHFARGAEQHADKPGYAETYMPAGRAPRKGELFRNRALAEVYESISKGGRDAFYRGDIGREIDRYMRRHDGLLRQEDLAGHSSEWVTPVSTNYRGWDVCELPPNGQGIAALQILNILEGFDLASMGFGSAEYAHAFVEAKKLAYEDRARYYADPSFTDVPVDTLISKQYAQTRRALINPDSAATGDYARSAPIEHGDTVYLTVADADGNMVSLIQSIYSLMGSGMTPARLGFALQNRATSFALDPQHANTLEPGKRPFHTIIPAFVIKDGEPLISFGVMGGAMQPQGHAQIIVNLVDFGMNLQEAGDAARIRHQGSSQPDGTLMQGSGVVHLESGFDDRVRQSLEDKGHVIGPSDGGFGGYQAILRDARQGVYYGASEVRKDGQAAGY
jgi:gamma-glutamyltranspeptidase/glutathione hydrolase